MPVGEASALELADVLRAGGAPASPYELWQAAERDSKTDTERRELYRHAMIHAGYLLTAAGKPYRRCSICREKLAR